MARRTVVRSASRRAAFALLLAAAACKTARPLAPPPIASAVASASPPPSVVDAAPDVAPPRKLPEIPVTWVAAHRNNTCAVRGGRVYCWGVGFSGKGWSTHLRPERMGNYEHAEAVGVGYQRGCVLQEGGVTCWGSGETGDGTSKERAHPVQVLGITQSVTAIAVSHVDTCAIARGEVWCWGGFHGLKPKRIEGLRTPVTVIGMSSSATCAASAAPEVFCWGSPTMWRTALGTLDDSSQGLSNIPKRLASEDAGVSGVVTAIAGGSGLMSAVGIVADGTLETWMPLASPRWTPPLRGVTAASIGGQQTCAIADGEVTCWKEFESAPIHVKLPGRATRIASGEDHHCAIAEGELYCWGSRAYPALGDGEPLCVPAWCWDSKLKHDGGMPEGTNCLEPPNREQCRRDEPVRIEFPAE